MPTLLLLLTFWLCNMISCRKTETGPIYQGRVEVLGICGNYTLSVIGGGIDPSRIESNWTDPTTQINYTQVFRLENPCDFPNSLKVGDSFSFRINPTPNQNCAQCMAYYPTPTKALAIEVVRP